MSFTSTMLWWSSAKMARPMASSTDWWYPRVSHFRLFSTRSGVRSKPSRAGFSSSFSSSSCTRSAMLASARRICLRCPLTSFSAVLDPVARRFPEDEAGQPNTGRQGRCNAPPEAYDQIFRGWIHTLQPGNVHVEIAMVHIGNDISFYQVTKLLEVD